MDRRAAVLLAFMCFCFSHQQTRAFPPSPVPDLLRTPVQAVAISPYDQILAGTFGNGIYASFDGGRTWIPRNRNLSNRNVFALAVKNGNLIFAGTFGGGVYRSADDQASGWVQVNNGLESPEVICLCIGQDGGLYAGTSVGKLYYSQDDGNKWVTLGDVGQYVNTIAVDDAGGIFAGTLNGVYRSLDRGMSWDRINTGLSCMDVWSLTTKRDGSLFAATNGGGIFRSSDRGEKWVQMNSGLGTKNTGSVAACPNGNLYVGTTQGVFVSYNDGETWFKFVSDPSNSAVRCLTIGLDGQLLVGSHWVDVFETDPVQPVPEKVEDVM